MYISTRGFSIEDKGKTLFNNFHFSIGNQLKQLFLINFNSVSLSF